MWLPAVLVVFAGLPDTILFLISQMLLANLKADALPSAYPKVGWVVTSTQYQQLLGPTPNGEGKESTW